MSTINKTIKTFYTELFNHGSYTDLIINYDDIKSLDKLYKENFLKFVNFSDFEIAYPTQFELFKRSKSAYKEIQKQHNASKGLQPCILTECFIAQTIANKFGLDQFIDLDDSASTVPSGLTGAIFAAKGYTDGSKFRYCYYNSHFDTILFQCGACGTVDIVFTKFNINIRIEVKEQVAKLEECDITGLYGEDGKLIISEEFKQKRTKYVPYVDLFNQLTDVFSMEGHNFKITDYLNKTSSKAIIDAVLGTKVIDVFVLVVDNKIIPVLSDHLTDFVSFEGSEIRTAGRNYGKVFTPEFVKTKIYSLGGAIDANNIVTMPYNPDFRIKGRGTNQYNRYGLGSLIFVKLEDATVVGDEIQFHFSKILQKKPTISIHLNAKDNCSSTLHQCMVVGILPNHY